MVQAAQITGVNEEDDAAVDRVVIRTPDSWARS
jgi:hypothetical protein